MVSPMFRVFSLLPHFSFFLLSLRGPFVELSWCLNCLHVGQGVGSTCGTQGLRENTFGMSFGATELHSKGARRAVGVVVAPSLCIS